MNDDIKAIKSLEIPDVKVYECVNNQLSVVTKGPLEVLYVAEYDRFLLRDYSFQYALSPYLSVMASLSEPRAFRAYILPSINGYYILKLKSPATEAIIKNFETILSNYSQLSYKSTDATMLAEQAKNATVYLQQAGSVNTNQPANVAQYRTPDNMARAGGAIKRGSESLKQNIIKAAYYIGKNIDNTANAVVNNTTSIVVGNINDLKMVQPNAQFIYLPRAGASKLISISNDIEQVEQTRASNPNVVVTNVQPQTFQTGWEGLKGATVTSANSVWSGIKEAGTIIAGARNNKKAKSPQVVKYTNVPMDANKQPNQVTVEKKKVVDYIPLDNNNKNVVNNNQTTHHYVRMEETTQVAQDDSEDSNLFVQNTGNQRLIRDIAEDNNGPYPHIDPAPGYTSQYFKNLNNAAYPNFQTAAP